MIPFSKKTRGQVKQGVKIDDKMWAFSFVCLLVSGFLSLSSLEALTSVATSLTNSICVCFPFCLTCRSNSKRIIFILGPKILA